MTFYDPLKTALAVSMFGVAVVALLGIPLAACMVAAVSPKKEKK